MLLLFLFYHWASFLVISTYVRNKSVLILLFVTEMLLEHEAELDVLDGEKNSALHHACINVSTVHCTLSVRDVSKAAWKVMRGATTFEHHRKGMGWPHSFLESPLKYFIFDTSRLVKKKMFQVFCMS